MGESIIFGLEQKLGFCLVRDIAIFARGVKINKMNHEGVQEAQSPFPSIRTLLKLTNEQSTDPLWI